MNDYIGAESVRPAPRLEPQHPRRIVVGITGASGSAIGIRVLELLRELGVESHLVVSAWGKRTIEHETDISYSEVLALADFTYRPNDQGSRISSGSFLTDGMVIAPCSMKTLASVAHGLGSGLVSRAADVTLKERRRLVVVPRESPLHEIHLQNMMTLSRMGVSIANPVPAFYNRPTSVQEIIDQIAARALDQLGLHTSVPRWNGLDSD
jgi:4-hydroxy-3-polyprenylbenzoate decarboxylase